MRVKEFNNLINLLHKLEININNEQIEKIYDLFFPKKNYEDKVLWRATVISTDKYPDAYERQGIITHEQYEEIQSANIPPNEEIYFDSLAKYVDLYCEFKDIVFIKDTEDIIDFLNNNEESYPLMDFLESKLETYLTEE